MCYLLYDKAGNNLHGPYVKDIGQWGKKEKKEKYSYLKKV